MRCCVLNCCPLIPVIQQLWWSQLNWWWISSPVSLRRVAVSLALGKGSSTVNSSQNVWKSKNTTGHNSICSRGQNLRLRPRQVLPLVLLQGKAIKLPQYHCGHPSTTWSAPLVINNSWPYQSRPLRMGQTPYPWCPAESTEQWRHPLPPHPHCNKNPFTSKQ